MNAVPRPVKTFFPQTRLSELVKRAGGISRDDAVAGALECLETVRSDCDGEIRRSMDSIEAIVAASDGKSLHASDMRSILQLSDQIVTLAGTFGYQALDKVMRSMCDVTDGLLQARLSDAAPIRVHAQAMRLMAPGSMVLSAGETDKVLSELAKILTHYNFGPLSAIDSPE
jgi:hypothetical protein